MTEYDYLEETKKSEQEGSLVEEQGYSDVAVDEELYFLEEDEVGKKRPWYVPKMVSAFVSNTKAAYNDNVESYKDYYSDKSSDWLKKEQQMRDQEFRRVMFPFMAVLFVVWAIIKLVGYLS